MNEIDASLYTTFTAATALTNLLSGTAAMYHMQAPEGAAYPYMVWSVQGGGDNNTEPHRVKDLVYFIRAYSADSAQEAGTIDAQIDAALHLQTLSVSGWTNLWMVRETDLETVENPPTGSRVYMVGGFYRLIVEQS